MPSLWCFGKKKGATNGRKNSSHAGKPSGSKASATSPEPAQRQSSLLHQISTRSLSQKMTFEQLKEEEAPSLRSGDCGFDQRCHVPAPNKPSDLPDKSLPFPPKPQLFTKHSLPSLRRISRDNAQQPHQLETLSENKFDASPPPLPPVSKFGLVLDESALSETGSSTSKKNKLPPPQFRPKRSVSVPNIRRTSSRDVLTDTTHRWVYESKAISLADFLNEAPSDYKARTVSRADSLAPSVIDPSAGSQTDRTQSSLPFSENFHSSDSGIVRPSISVLTIPMDSVDDVIRMKEAKSVYSDFSKLLLSPIGRECFQRYLASNLCEENFLFYNEVAEALKPPPEAEADADVGSLDSVRESVNDPATYSSTGFMSPKPAVISGPRLLELERIYDDFVVDGAPNMVNLKDERRRAIRNELLTIGGTGTLAIQNRIARSEFASVKLIDAFRSAQHEILILMKTDNFPRFLESEYSVAWKAQCLDAVDKVSEVEKERQKKEAAIDKKLAKEKAKAHHLPN